jgi:outer membrane protein OmpA-like peptidoglycan-associated protein
MFARTLVSICILAVSLNAQAPAARKAAAAKTTAPAAPDTDKEIKLGEDEPGCKDSTLIARIPGCSIIQCDTKEMDSIDIQVGASLDGVVQKENMDGASEVIYYLCPVKMTPANIAKTADAALVKSGYKVVFNGKDGDDQPIVTALKETQWIQISTYMYNEYGAYIQTAIKVPPEDQANAEAFSEEMNKNGRVVLEGVAFKGEALDPASEKALTEIAGILVRQPDWRVRIEGHTDNTGNHAENQALSQKQASAVATWLLEHGIDKSRVSIQGLGDTKPVADNATEDGRNKNRRIELVKF